MLSQVASADFELLETPDFLECLSRGVKSEDQSVLCSSRHKGYLSHFLRIGELLSGSKSLLVQNALGASSFG